MANYEDAVRFNFRCPYTDKKCDRWNCNSCSHNTKEEEWVKEREDVVTEESTRLDDIRKALTTIAVTGIKECQNTTDAKWQKRIKEIKADILRYKSDCEMAEDAVECKMCNKTMFDSILRIIDKHTKEGR